MRSEQLSRLRQSLRRLHEEQETLIALILSGKPIAKGSVYALRRKCGRPSCRCAAGRLHTSAVLSRSEKGRTHLLLVPKGNLAEWRILTKRYQRFRKARARLVKLHRQMLAAIDQIDDARRVTLSRCA